MKINEAVFEKIKAHGASLVAVTKYWSAEETNKIVQAAHVLLEENFLGIGENRVESLQSKTEVDCPLHFIGNIQSRQIKQLDRVRTIHSLCNLKHAQRLNELAKVRGWPLEVFVQVKISDDPQKFGLEPSEFEAFLKVLQTQKNLQIKGISAMGAGDFDFREKEQEFIQLKKIRDAYFPGLAISAGTSRDYEIALYEGIDIVRVGQALIQ